MRTGENAFRHVHGTNVWDYRSTHLEESAILDRAMQSLTRAAQSALLEAFDFGGFQKLVDVGGGNGAFLAAVLPAYPNLHGVVFDQSHVVRIGAANKGPLPKFSDLNMLVAPGGRVRTLDEFRELFEAAGLELSSLTPTRSELNVLEARPASK